MITKIFHIADVHIRKGNYFDSRYIEYSNVFNNTIHHIRSMYIQNQSVCVICGDLFHHKLQISSHGIVLFYKLIHGIADLMPVIIIQGNHDLIQENDDENNDLIKALLDNHKHHNIHYKDSTCSFDMENIHFGLVSIRDMLNKMSGSGLVDDLPPFPETNPNKLNIALSHATVQNCVLHNYTKTTCGIPLEWFKEYDAVLFGDVHLQSTKYNKKHNIYYGYPGSLVQQDFGESIFNHGFLVWNICEKTNQLSNVEKFHVHNNIGRTNAKMMNNEVYINAQNYITLNEFLDLDSKPNDLHIRLYCKENSSTIRNNIRTELEKHDINAHVDIVSANILNQDNDSLSNINVSSLNSSNIIIEFFKSHGNQNILNKNTNWEQYFESNNSTLLMFEDDIPTNIKSKVIEKNTKLSKSIENSPSTFNHKQNTIQIHKIRFDWLLSFGKNNEFIFTNNNICLINAPNGYGKSAFFECIIIGLFGEPIPSRYNKTSASSIINKQKPHNSADSNITIDFSVNDIRYTIKRHFYEKQSKNEPNRLQTLKVELYENNSLIKTSTKLVNKWVNENVCSIQDFLLSTMVTQNFDNDFFKLKMSDQIELLDNVLHMDKVNHISNLMKESKKEYKDLKNHIDTYINALKPSSVFNQEEFENMVSSHKKTSDELIKFKNIFNEINIPIHKIITINDDVEKPEETLQEILNLESNITKELNILNVDQHDKLFNTFELSVEQFIHEDFVGKPSKCLKFNKQTSVETLIKKLRELHDKYDYLQYTLNNLNSTKPIGVNETEDDYNVFNSNLIKFRKKCKQFDIQIPNEPDFDITDLKNNLNQNLINLSNKELNEMLALSEQKESIGDHKYNPECWACQQNFQSNESIDITTVIEYREKEQQFNQWTNYVKNKKGIDTLNKLEEENKHWLDVLPQIKAFDTWQTERTDVLSKMSILKQTIIDQQHILEQSFDYQHKCNEAYHLYRELDKYKLKKLYFINEKVKAKYNIEHFEKKEKDLLIQITKYEIIRNQEIEFNKNKVLLEDLINLLNDKIDLFNHFVDTFKVYKSWIYNEKLLPAIVKQANIILNHIFTNRLLELRFKFIDNNVLFTVMDENNEINIEKLSGAQSFAVSLSFRLALSSIGINKFRCNQLFIDEGFCSFDQKNLLNVPVLIKNLKNLFHEIILVTHLEEIKSCADCVINITRHKGISTICH